MRKLNKNRFYFTFLWKQTSQFYGKRKDKHLRSCLSFGFYVEPGAGWLRYRIVSHSVGTTEENRAEFLWFIHNSWAWKQERIKHWPLVSSGAVRMILSETWENLPSFGEYLLHCVGMWWCWNRIFLCRQSVWWEINVNVLFVYIYVVSSSKVFNLWAQGRPLVSCFGFRFFILYKSLKRLYGKHWIVYRTIRKIVFTSF